MAAAATDTGENARSEIEAPEEGRTYDVVVVGGGPAGLSAAEAAALFHPISRVSFLSPSREVRFEYPDPVCCVLDVRGVYQHLAGRAIATGRPA